MTTKKVGDGMQNRPSDSSALITLGGLAAIAATVLVIGGLALRLLLPVLPFAPLIWAAFCFARHRRIPWVGILYGYGLLFGGVVAVSFLRQGNIIPLVLLVIGVVLFVILRTKKKGPTSAKVDVKRGTKLASHQGEIEQYLERKQRDYLQQSGQIESLPRLTIGGIALPTYLENLGFFMIGSPGTGKSQAIAQILSEMRQREDFRLICFDRNGEFMEKFHRPGDILFNPADSRSLGWSHISEKVRYENIADALIPDTSGDDRFFSDAAKALLADLYERCDNNFEVWEVLSSLSLEELTDFLKGGLSHRYFISEKTGGSVLSTAINYLRFYRELPNHGEFSFSEWARDDNPRSLWLPLFEADSELFKPLYSAAFELVIRGLLSNEGRQIKTAIVIDELGALNRLKSLARLMSESRKFKGCPLLGIQTEAQIRKGYGQEDARILLQGAKSKLVLGCSDPETAELGANLIGKQDRIETSISEELRLFGKASKTQSVRETYAVMPSELQALPNLEGYLAISDGTPPARVKLAYRSYPSIAPRLLTRELSRDRGIER